MTTAHNEDAPGSQWPGAQRAYRGRAMDSAISNDELARRLDDLSAMIREDIAEIKTAHAAFVLREVYEARHTALRADVAKLETRLTQEADQRRNLSRWVIGSVVLPIVFFAYQVLSNVQGGGT